MIIESANLSSLAPSSGTIESATSLLIDGAGISEGFSGALMEQIGLLNNMKAGDLFPLQTQDITGLQGVAALPATTQDFAALLGNDLPPSYETKDNVDHEAALAAVTDALKYIAMDIAPTPATTTATKEETAVVEQNTANDTATTVPAEQNVENMPVMAVPVGQNAQDLVIVPEQSVKDIAMDTPVQTDLAQGNEAPDKTQVEGDAQLTVVENNGVTEELLAAAVILPPVVQAEQAKVTNNLGSADANKEGRLLSFTKPLIVDAKPNQPANAPDNMLQTETVFRQPVQDKQGFNLNYFQNSGQTEKTGVTEQQVLNSEGEKALSRVGSEITQPSKVVDNKTDVPTMTKPLSHPEWSKDLGERIVWMNSRAIPSADIRLNPPHLGPISVRVDVSDDQATVVFTAQHTAVREMLEASIPKLREMMGAQQLNLVEANVFQGPAPDQGRSQSQNFAQTADGRRQVPMSVVADGAGEVEQEIASGQAVVSNGLLSIYA